MDVTGTSNVTNDVIGFTTSPFPITNATNDTTKLNECGVSVHDIRSDKTTRLVILYVTICLGILGATLVILWMICSKKTSARFNQFSRVNAFILNLTFADLSVILMAVMPQLIWEYVDREWSAGPVMCRLVKFCQSFSMMSSNYMLVAIAIDRHQAIRSPLKESISIWKLAGTAWLLAILFSLPVTGIFHTNLVNGKYVCENIFRTKPVWHRQIWLTFVSIIVFFIPLVLMAVCYLRIFCEISTKATQNSVKVKRRDNGKGGCATIPLQSTHSNSLPKAKIKTLKMTFVIIMVFVVSSSPYFICEMILSYGNHCWISRKLYGLLGGMAACNSATNPFVFLAFNVKFSKVKDMFRVLRSGRAPDRHHRYNATTSTTAGNNSHYGAHIVHRNSHYSCQPFLRQDTKESSVELREI